MNGGRNDTVLTDEFCFSVQHHDGQIRVKRHCGERLLNGCVLHHHTSSACIMVWDGIAFYCRTYLVRIGYTLNSQHYSREVLEAVILPYICDKFIRNFITNLLSRPF
ncbi:transposable element Tc3 transposase [Trichonephila clavipes]|nr:transposable element Tc3 transposase [Trichonephila clavipes]